MGFQKATKKASKLRLALMGVSGTGKTYTALTFAKALSKKGIAVIDTEHGSASLYAGEVADFDVLELHSYDPSLYIRAMDDAARAGYDVLVIDSLSHAWSGKGGILEQKDAAQNGFDAWRKLTPKHNDLVDAILAWPGHVICTMRAKQDHVQEKNEQGRTVIRKVGLAAVQRDGMEYEFTVVGLMNDQHAMEVTKSRCSAVADANIRKPGAEFVQTLLAWLDSGEASIGSPPPPAVDPPKPPRSSKEFVLAHCAAIDACTTIDEFTSTCARSREAVDELPGRWGSLCLAHESRTLAAFTGHTFEPDVGEVQALTTLDTLRNPPSARAPDSIDEERPFSRGTPVIAKDITPDRDGPGKSTGNTARGTP